MDTITTEALRYREALNLGVFPVDPVSKKPRFAKWQRGGLRAKSSIEQVFSRNLDAAIGVPGGQMLPPGDTVDVLPSGIEIQQGRFVLQLDVDERNFGIEALSELPRLPRTATAKTPNGYHFWFWSREPVAAFTRPDGLEIKGLGAFTIEPPAPERAWTRNPFDHEIAEAPDFLLERIQGNVELQHNPSTLEWGFEFGNPLELVRSALPGARRATLLRQAGRINYRLVWKGLLDERLAKEQLRAAAEENGTDQKEIERILKYVFDSPPFTPSTTAPTGGVLLNVVVPLSASEKAVLRAVCRNYEPELLQGRPLPSISTKITSYRWLEAGSGVPRMTVGRCLKNLHARGLLWKAQSVKLKGRERERACSRYRPTFSGLAVSEVYANVSRACDAPTDPPNKENF